jgi:hypothetical protein
MTVRTQLVKRAFEATCGPKVRYLAHETFTHNGEPYLAIHFIHRKDRHVNCRLDGHTLSHGAREIGRAACTDAEEIGCA